MRLNGAMNTQIVTKRDNLLIRHVVMRVRPIAETMHILRGVERTGTCTMRVLPVDPSMDEKMLTEPDATRDYTIKTLPQPCQASHPARPRPAGTAADFARHHRDRTSAVGHIPTAREYSS